MKAYSFALHVSVLYQSTVSWPASHRCKLPVAISSFSFKLVCMLVSEQACSLAFTDMLLVLSIVIESSDSPLSSTFLHLTWIHQLKLLCLCSKHPQHLTHPTSHVRCPRAPLYTCNDLFKQKKLRMLKCVFSGPEFIPCCIASVKLDTLPCIVESEQFKAVDASRRKWR